LRFATFLFALSWAGLGLQAQQKPMDTPQQPNMQPAANAAPLAADAQTASAKTSAPTLQSRDPRYRLNKTDVLSLNFVFTPEYDQNVQVQPDGYILPRGVEAIHAEGLTIPELTAALESEYGKILHDPVITVLPTNIVPAYFIAGGEVKNPGRYTFQGDTTLSQAVEIAGGFNTTAKHSQVLLFRRINNDWVQGSTINLKKMLKGANLAEDPHLQPGDMVYVPQNTISKLQPWLQPFSEFFNVNLLTRPITF
jgi:protein involved in polysaccharide export with SLBB domain